MDKCKFNTARTCDGLCNNCPKKYVPDGIYRGITTSRQRCNEGDYEGLILAKQESDYD